MKNYTDVLKTVRLFKGIEEADLQPLLSCLAAKSVRFEKGQTVFSSGESIENSASFYRDRSRSFRMTITETEASSEKLTLEICSGNPLPARK